MIQIPRNLARQLRAVLRKAGVSRTEQPLLEMNWSQGELRIRAQMSEAAIEYREPRPLGVESCLVPFVALDQVAGKSSTPVYFSKSPLGVEAQWDDGAFPQRKIFPVDEKSYRPPFPELDWQTKLVVPGLLPALGHASQCTKGDHLRFATEKIQLRGERGEMIATDGRQALIQTGFSWPWKEDLLVPGLALFGSREFLPDSPAVVSKGENHLGIKVGENWTIILAIDKTGRFPNVATVLPRITASAATWRLAPQDAIFLTRSLEKLPGQKDDHAPVTVDLDGQVAVRAKEEGQTEPTELILSGSEVTGKAVRFHVDRRFLARAISLGFTEFSVVEPSVPITCKDATRTYVWVPLAASSAIPPSKNALRITSQESSVPISIKERMNPPMPTSNSNGVNQANGAVPANGDSSNNGVAEHADSATPVAGTNIGALIAEAQALRDYLQDGHARASRLCVSLKRHRKQSKIVASTLASLKQLQQIDD